MAVIDQALYLETFPFFDVLGELVTGKVTGDWTKIVIRNGATYAAAVTVTEDVDNAGYYTPSLTPDAVGDWTVALVIAIGIAPNQQTYRFGGSFRVITAQQADPVAAVGLTSARVAKLDRIGDIDVTVVSPTTESANLTIYQGATYDSDESRALVFSIVGASDLTGSTVTLLFSWGVDSLSVTGATSNEGAATQTVTVELTATQTASLPSSGVSYSLTAVLANTHVEPLQTGRVIVIPSLPAN